MCRIFYFVFILLLGICFASRGQSVSYVARLTAPSNIDQTLPVGSTAGALQVSATGAATYEIPIKPAPGVGGVIPKISLVYNSQGGSGVAGYGWNISGLSAITRTGSNYYHDGMGKPVEWNSNDHYSLDGVRLFPVPDVNGNPTDQYKTESETWSAIQIFNANTSDAWFRLTAKDGTTYDYGSAPNGGSNASRVFNKTKNAVLIWRLDKITDVNGNMIEFNYENLKLQVLGYTILEENLLMIISHGANINNGGSHIAAIKLNYSMRADINTAFVAGSPYTQLYALDNISVYNGPNDLIRRYKCIYVKDDIHSFLQSIRESGTNGSELNETQFLYGDTSPGMSTEDVTGLYNPSGNGHLRTYSGDFNGDGYGDAAQTTMTTNPNDGADYPTGFIIRLFNPNTRNFDSVYSFTVPSSFRFMIGYPIMDIKTTKTSGADFDGDGKDDIVLARLKQDTVLPPVVFLNVGLGSPDTPTCGFFNGSQHLTRHYKVVLGKNFLFTGDFDANGKSDFILVAEDHLGQAACFLGSATSSYRSETVQFSTHPGLNDSIINLIRHAAYVATIDINGDGREELFFVTDNDPDSKSFITRWHSIFPGDFNGDGKTDILTRVYNNITKWEIGWSDGYDFNTIRDLSFTFQPEYRTQSNGWRENGSDDHINIADFNGDGKSDILRMHLDPYQNIDYYYMFYSTGTNTWKYETYTFPHKAGFTGSGVLADITGDGKTDLLYSSWYNGANFILKYGLYSFKHSAPGDRCLKTVRNGLGLQDHINYLPLSSTDPNHYKFNGHTPYPFNTLKIPLLTVASTNNTLLNQPSFNKVYYRYEDLKFARDGRGVIGFNISLAIRKLPALSKRLLPKATTLSFLSLRRSTKKQVGLMGQAIQS